MARLRLDEPLSRLTIGRRIRTALARAGLATISDLLRLSRDELLRLRGIGPRSVDALAEELRRHGARLGAYAELLADEELEEDIATMPTLYRPTRTSTTRPPLTREVFPNAPRVLSFFDPARMRRDDYQTLPAERHRKHAELAAHLAEALERSGQPYVAIEIAGANVVGFLCPYCRLLAWTQPSRPWEAYHDGAGCASFHRFGPRAFLAQARQLGRLPGFLPGRR